jgi:hypothetical protein
VFGLEGGDNMLTEARSTPALDALQQAPWQRDFVQAFQIF